jgi:hypothetical protein
MPENTPSEADLAWKAAQAALDVARQLPAGAERFEALKQAGKLRLEADRQRTTEIGPIQK